MLAIFLKTLPFFAVIGVGYWAGRTRFFSEEATGYLTKFVFYFALSAMLFRFAANLSLAEVLDWQRRYGMPVLPVSTAEETLPQLRRLMGLAPS